MPSLTQVHLDQLSHDWLGDYRSAFYSVIFTNIWEFVGLTTVVFLAGLQTVPEELLEAAHLDGANAVATLLACYLSADCPCADHQYHSGVDRQPQGL